MFSILFMFCLMSFLFGAYMGAGDGLVSSTMHRIRWFKNKIASKIDKE